MDYLHGKFVWFEHVSNDLSKARAFYGDLFGWRSDGVPVGGQTYHMILNGSDAVGGFRPAMPGMPNHWISYLSVPDVDQAAAAASAGGGTIVLPPTDFAPFGRAAAIADPNGAVFALWKATQGDRPDAQTVRAGDWYWNECMSADAQKALGFYETTFGFAHDTMDLADGPYYVLTMKGVPRAGVMKSPSPGQPSAWLPYVSVADCDSTAKRAQALGAQVFVPPTDIPDVGRFAVLGDPVGAVIGVIHGKFSA
jgi:predicted enzyme related to lactoylglutathione lyase